MFSNSMNRASVSDSRMNQLQIRPNTTTNPEDKEQLKNVLPSLLEHLRNNPDHAKMVADYLIGNVGELPEPLMQLAPLNSLNLSQTSKKILSNLLRNDRNNTGTGWFHQAEEPANIVTKLQQLNELLNPKGNTSHIRLFSSTTNRLSPRELLDRELNNNYSAEVKKRILNCFDNKSSFLDLSYSFLTEIPSNRILSQLSTHLTTLNLSNNQITSIPENAFSGLTSLQELNLSVNRISEIPKDVFAMLTHLQRLSLSYNKISSIHENAFSGLTQLEELGLFCNQITLIPENAFSGLTQLEELILSANQIISIHENAFSGLTSLRRLMLQRNQVNEIHKDVFAGLTQLEALDLSLNQITSIPENAFSGLTSLQNLDLSYNQSIVIKANAFAGLTNLKLLRSYGKRLNALDPLLRDIANNAFLKRFITVKMREISIDQNSLIEAYLFPFYGNHAPDEIVTHQLLGEYCLRLLQNNNLQEPEAIKLLAMEISNGSIPLAKVYPAKDLRWICQLLSDNNLPLLPFLMKNQAVFKPINWQASIVHKSQLIVPPSSKDIEYKLRQQLFSVFVGYNLSLDRGILQEVLTNFTSGGGVAKLVDDQIKIKINETLTSLLSDSIEVRPEQVDAIMNAINYNHANNNRVLLIKQAVAQIIPEGIDEESFNTLKEQLTEVMCKIDRLQIQKDIVATNCQALGILDSEDNYAKLERFCNWQSALNDLTNITFQEFATSTMETLAEFKSNPEVYSKLILNCTQFLTYKNLCDILETVPLEITQECQKQLEAIIEYCRTFEINDVTDVNPIKVLFINVSPMQVLQIDKLSDLNPDDLDIKLEDIKIVTLNGNPSESISIPLNANNFKEVEASLPIWLAQLIKNQFTVANTLARVINNIFIEEMSKENINFTPEITHKLTKIFYANGQKLGLDINISAKDKKEMMVVLKDQALDYNKLDQTDLFSKQFAEIVELQSMTKYKRQEVDDEELKRLPDAITTALQSKPYFKTLERLTDALTIEFTKYAALKDIKPYEIYHLLGAYFANLSSIRGLGYHVGDENRSFLRFRFYAAICLSQVVVTAPANLAVGQKLNIAKEIKNLLFSSECAGQIANRLYGQYSQFTDLTKRIQQILDTRIL